MATDSFPTYFLFLEGDHKMKLTHYYVSNVRVKVMCIKIFNFLHLSSPCRSVRAFQELLYVCPDFQRANEAHLRLGFMFKVLGDYERSLKHYQLALIDQRTSCSFSNLECESKIKFFYLSFLSNL